MADDIKNTNNDESAKICAAMVEKDDHDRYLTTLFAKMDDRRSLYALYAFNIEVAKTLETTKETMISEMKLQWWHDSLVALEQGTIHEHPVVIEIAHMVASNEISVNDLMILIDTRRTELNHHQPNTLDTLIDYCRNTAGTINKIAAKIMYNNAEDIVLKHAENIGIAWGLVGIIRAISFHASASRCMIPADLMEKANIDEQQLYQGEFSPALNDVIKHMAEQAEWYLNTDDKTAVKKYKIISLLAPLAKSYLGQLNAKGYDIQTVDFSKGAFSRLRLLTWTAITGRH